MQEKHIYIYIYKDYTDNGVEQSPLLFPDSGFSKSS